jgi:hypothetical protein
MLRLSMRHSVALSILSMQLYACGEDSPDSPPPGPSAGGFGAATTGGTSAAPGGAASNSGGATSTSGGSGSGTTGGVPSAGGGPSSTGGSVATGGTPAASGGGTSSGGTTSTGGSVSTGGRPAPTGPEDGDPAKPMVAIPGVPCGVPRVSYGMNPPTVKIGNRDVVVTYPCAHEGARVTFLFTLHGTLSEAQKIAFTMTSGPFYKLTDSHNLIYVLPKAIGTQWGREDNGADKPHLYEVVDWVYANFGTKFEIRSMWAQGGSWGAAYLSSTFACDARFQDKLKGVRLIVGGGCPSCSNRLACIVAQQELEKGGGNPMTPEQRNALADAANITPYATTHGCDAKTGPTDVGNTKYWSWPNCDSGFVHSYYLAPGQHADPWDPIAIEKTTVEMKSIE